MFKVQNNIKYFGMYDYSITEKYLNYFKTCARQCAFSLKIENDYIWQNLKRLIMY